MWNLKDDITLFTACDCDAKRFQSRQAKPVTGKRMIIIFNKIRSLKM